MRMGSDRARPAYVEEVDESGRALQETRRSAHTPNKGHRTVKGARRVTLEPDRGNIPRTTLRVEVSTKESAGIDSPKKSTRHYGAHQIQEYSPLGVPSSAARYDPSYFAMGTPNCVLPPQPIMLAHRPRPAANTFPRPHGGYGPIPPGAYGPPLSSSAFYPQNTPLRPGFPPPPPSPSFGDAPYGGFQNPIPQSDFAYHPPPPTSRPLASRFQSIHDPVVDPISRTSSAFGMRDTPRLAYPDSFDEEGYNSVSEVAPGRKKKHWKATGTHSRSPLFRDEEYEAELAMPPPPPSPPAPAPSSKPRHGILRRSHKYPGTHYDHNDHHEARLSYQDAPRSRRPSVSYDLTHGGESVRLEPVSSRSRRQSWHNKSGPNSSNGYEAKLQQASSYLDEATGPGSSTPLTVETLRKQQRRQDSSSRSTKSSASRDESDFKKSVTTRTTRSTSAHANNDENMTIKVTGSARVMVAGAQIECTDGGAIEIKRDKAHRDTSERPSPDYVEGRRAIEDRDRQSRYEKPPARSRISSQPYRQSSSRRDTSGDFF